MSETATHQQKDHQNDEQEATYTKSSASIVTATVSIKSTAAEEQQQHYN